MARPSVRRVAWLALLAAVMHLLLPAGHAIAAGGVARGVLAGAATLPAAFCLSPGSPSKSLLQTATAPGGNPTPSHDMTSALCPLCIAGAMAAVLPAAPELTAWSGTLSHVLAGRAVDVPAPGGVLLSFLSRGPPAQG